jgi:putative transposase
VAESFFSSLKKERIRKRIYKTRDQAKADVFDYIEVFWILPTNVTGMDMAF